MATDFKMNKRVFHTLAVLCTTPQDALIKNELIITSHGEDGKNYYGISQFNDKLNDYVHWGNDHTLTDLRKIGRLAEELTGKISLIEITSLVLSGQVKLPQKNVISKYWNDDYDGSPREQHHTYLHLLHKVKVNPKARTSIEEAEAKGLI